jgi:hypothetical protein
LGYLSPPPSPAPVIVYKDVGGLVSDYEAQTEAYRRDNREVRLHECRSACTLALSLPNVCVYPDAKVKFHQAYNAINREVDLGVSARLFSSYPAAVQGRLGTLTREYRVLTGTELIALGLRNCNGNDDNRVMIAARKPAPAAPLAGSSPLGDIAQSVRTAVASAWARPDSATSEPLRVAVPDRRPIPPTLARLSGEGGKPSSLAIAAPVEELAPAAGLPRDIPLPPRRPPSAAFSAQEAPPPFALDQLIKGARPILASRRFTLRAEAAR